MRASLNAYSKACGNTFVSANSEAASLRKEEHGTVD